MHKQKLQYQNSKDRFINVEEANKQIELTSVLTMFDVSSKKDLLIQIGQKSIQMSSIVNKVFDQNRSVEEQIDNFKRKSYQVKQVKYKGDIIVEGASTGIKIEPAVCCKPIPGDKIIGFITRGSGIKVHRTDCPNVINEKRRLIDARWNDIGESTVYPVDLEIVSYDRNNLLVDLMGLISASNIRIDSISAKSHYENKTATLTCTVYLKDIEMLYTLISKIKSITGIVEVNRISH